MRRGARAAWAIGGLVVLAGVVAAGVVGDRGRTAQAEADAAEPTAWQELRALEGVLPGTARAVGLDGEVDSDPYGPIDCVRNDGRRGFAYSLAKVQAPPVDDVPALLSRVEAHWDDAGHDARQGEFAGVPAVTATTALGSQLRVIAGPVGTGFAGETGCFLVDGEPG